MDAQGRRLARLGEIVDSKQIEHLRADKPQCRRIHARGELERQHAHADQVAAVDALEAGGDYGTDAEQASAFCGPVASRSEEHTSELQSLMRISYAVFCCKKKK